MGASLEQRQTARPAATGRRRRQVLRRGVAAAAGVAVASSLAACALSSTASSMKGVEGVKGGSEVAAAPVSSAGANPFTPPAGSDMANVKPPPGVMRTAGGPPTYGGNLPGLYGGTRNYATCDADKMIAFLQQNPDKARAWAGVFGIQVTQISDFVHGLTPVILRVDTRVTNHGYVNGVANPIQSVLEAGTAVLVNRYGEPVVKCYCGNPLSSPVLYTSPVYVGTYWPSFQPMQITIIQQSTTIINEFKLYDPNTGRVFTRPAGTDGQSDGPYIQKPPANPMTAPPSAPPPPAAPQPQVPGSSIPTPTQPPSSNPPPRTDTNPSRPPAPSENPSADFSPNPGHQGDTFQLSVSGFAPNASLDITLTRPDGVVEHYSLTTSADGSGTYTFSDTQNVVTGTYNAVVTNPASGASASASVDVQPAAGSGAGSGSGSGSGSGG
jgi:hypothetical protein